jgi:hypothetical protein
VTRRICGVMVVAMLVVVPAGCGSDKNDNAPTKAEFLKQGNAICTAGNHKIDAAGKKTFANGKPTAEKLNAFATKTLIPNIQSEITAIGNLTPPKGDEAQVKKIVASAQAALDKGKADPALLTANNAGPFAKSNKITTAYGLKVCGSS